MEREVGNCVGCEFRIGEIVGGGEKAVRFRWEDWTVGQKREIGGACRWTDGGERTGQCGKFRRGRGGG